MTTYYTLICTYKNKDNLRSFHFNVTADRSWKIHFIIDNHEFMTYCNRILIRLHNIIYYYIHLDIFGTEKYYNHLKFKII